MKIAVVCANGKEGQLITKEAVNCGFDVIAVVRGENKSEATKAIVKDLFDLTKEDLMQWLMPAVRGRLKHWTLSRTPLKSCANS